MKAWERGSMASLALLLILTACTSGAPASPTASASPQGQVTVTPTWTVSPTATPVPSRTPTPTQTEIPLPAGLGPTEPELQINLGTAFEAIGPGEYLIVWDIMHEEARGEDRYRYLSWDGSKGGVLFSVTSRSPNPRHNTVLKAALPTIVFELREYPDTEDLFFANLQSLEAFQFIVSRNSGCSTPLSPGNVGVGFFAFPCSLSDNEARWVLVRIENLEFVASVGVPEEWRIGDWLSERTFALSSPWENDRTSACTCLLSDPDWEMTCYQTTYRVADASPDGEWLLVELSGFPDLWDQISTPYAILPTRCLGVEGEGCEPRKIELPREWQGAIPAGGDPMAWSDGETRLAFVVVGCLASDERRTWLWYYDVESQQPSKIGSVAGCYGATPRTVFWSADGDRVAMNDIYPEQPARVLLLDGRSYALPIAGQVVGTFRVP